MDPKFQTSFIPKKPVVSGVNTKTVKVYTGNIFSIIAWIFFLAAILASSGLYLYTMLLNGQIDQAGKDIDDARKALQVNKIQDLIEASAKIKTSQDLLSHHLSASGIFSAIQTATLKNIHFNSMTYTNNGGVATISMPGESQSYNALIQQQKIFENNPDLQSPAFTNFALVDNGRISFDFTTKLSPSLVSYARLFQELNPVSGTTTNQGP